jgi:formylglycine-generating enzyme required for sulfatase activity
MYQGARAVLRSGKNFLVAAIIAEVRLNPPNASSCSSRSLRSIKCRWAFKPTGYKPRLVPITSIKPAGPLQPSAQGKRIETRHRRFLDLTWNSAPILADVGGARLKRKMSGKVFISYRRDDSSAWAGRLYDRLFQHFSQNEIFMDVDTIEPGVDFVEAIEEVVGACDVLIAVIGSRWLTSSDRGGRRRLDIPEDIVRLEIATALKRGIRVVPVLVDNATMPEVGELPDDLKALVRRNAVEIGHNRFNADSERLVTALERALGKATEQRERLDREQRDRAATEIRERQEKEQLDARRREHEEQERLETEQREKARLEAERQERERAAAKPTVPVAAVTLSPPVIATPTVEEKVRSSLERATKDNPWQNSLGMKFVPVAAAQVLFSVWDTRVEDFEAFVNNAGYNAGADWKNPGFNQGPTYPVVKVSWKDAKAFCQWLTQTEQALGRLPNGMLYRLPTDQEWSLAVGLPSEPGDRPDAKDLKIKVCPWGTQWPPPKGAGNYCGEESKVRTTLFIKGYKDDYVYTSPADSFAANQFGLQDMGGNVWQWCEDWYNPEKRQSRVVRGASWFNGNPDVLLASSRSFSDPDRRGSGIGFRCVVSVESSR